MFTSSLLIHRDSCLKSLSSWTTRRTPCWSLFPALRTPASTRTRLRRRVSAQDMVLATKRTPADGVASTGSPACRTSSSGGGYIRQDFRPSLRRTGVVEFLEDTSIIRSKRLGHHGPSTPRRARPARSLSLAAPPGPPGGTRHSLIPARSLWARVIHPFLHRHNFTPLHIHTSQHRCDLAPAAFYILSLQTLQRTGKEFSSRPCIYLASGLVQHHR